MNPFLYVIVLHPSKKAQEDGSTPKIIPNQHGGLLGVVLAADEAAARTIAAREIPSEHEPILDRVKVHLRPFLGS